MSSDADVDAVIELGRLSLVFSRVDRITYHEDGTTPESDTDHTVMLGLVGCAFAARFLPELDLGLIAQYALVHDLVEVYAGDTPTLRINDEQKASKRDREHAALVRITEEFAGTLPWIPTMIGSYEWRRAPEARYVKALDKLLPKITHILNDLRTIHDQGMSRDELAERYEQQVGELQVYASDFPPLFDLRAELVRRVMDIFAAKALAS
jgi:putative hydrolase of HD superfamily